MKETRSELVKRVVAENQANDPKPKPLPMLGLDPRRAISDAERQQLTLLRMAERRSEEAQR